MLRHIVLIRARKGTDEAVIAQACKMLKGLKGSVPGLLEWKVAPSLDSRKGVVIVENALFATPEDLQAFRQTIQHQELTDFLRQSFDWTVGDYIENV